MIWARSRATSASRDVRSGVEASGSTIPLLKEIILSLNAVWNIAQGTLKFGTIASRCWHEALGERERVPDICGNRGESSPDDSGTQVG